MPDGPVYKAGYTHVLLDALKELFPAESAVVEQGPAVKRIRETARVDWMPAEWHLEFIESTRHALGTDERFASFIRAASGKQIQSPLVRPLVEAATRLFGMDVRSVLKWMPRTWDGFCRNMGSMAYEPGDGASVYGRLVITGLPRFLAESRTFIASMQAGFSVIYDTFKSPGRIDIKKVDVERGEVVYEYLRGP